MTDNITLPDATADTKTVRTTDTAGVHTPWHLEDSTQRAALITAIGLLSSQTTAAAILAKLIAAPATEAKQDTLNTAVALIGTRAYGTGARTAIGTSSAQSAAITATEVMVHARGGSGYIVTGSSPTATVATGIPIEDGEKFHLRITSGHKVAVIGDEAAGYLHVVPVS